jgi:L-iditol 2-dehydrogenase
MKSAFLVGSKQFELRDVPEPKPGISGVVVDIVACGVCGSDLRRWREGPAIEPVVSGHEISGTVSAAGADVKNFRVGERIAIAPDIHCGECYYCRHALYNLFESIHFLGITPGYPGGFAEKILLTEEVLTLGVVHKMPDGLSFDHAALSEPCSSVLACHDRIHTSIDDVVVVMGAGPIGCIHTAVAHARGARVIISEPSEIRRRLSEEFKPELLINPFEQNLNDAVREFTEGRGADIVICANPVPATQTQAVEIVKKRGRVMLFGGLPKDNHMVSLDGNRIHYNEIEVIGSFSYHPTYHEQALEALLRGLIPADKLITAIYPLNEVSKGFEAAAGGEALKVLIKPYKA